MTFHLRLLSRFRLLTPDDGEVIVKSKKLQLLIAVLSLADGKPVSRTELVALLWSDRAEDQARNSLRQALTTLRQLTGPSDAPLFEIDADWVTLDPRNMVSDIQQLLKPDVIPAKGWCVPTGEFLEGLQMRDDAIETWLRDQRAWVHERKIELLTQGLERYIGADDFVSALVQARHILSIEPANEWAHKMAMLGLALTGDRTAALQQFQQCKESLQAHFDIAPEAGTLELFDKIAKNDATLASFLPARVAGQRHQPNDVSVPEDRPSIAVMPFTVLSDHSDQQHFTDALTKSITSALARFKDLLVIASFSTFTYKDSAPSLTQVRRELGVRYIVEGSVQFAGDQLRVTAQLIDTQTQGHVWTERYQRSIDDIFQVQDDVTERIVGSIANSYGGRVRTAWNAASTDKRTPHYQAFDFFQRGLNCLEAFDSVRSTEAIENFNKALEIDPTYAKPMAKLSWVYLLGAIEGWASDYEASFEMGWEAAQKAMKLDPTEAWSHWAMAGCLFYQGEQERGMTALEKAHQLNPNDADILFDLGYYQGLCGDHEHALDNALKALRLNPHYPLWYLMELVQIYFDARRYEDATATYRRIAENRLPAVALFAGASYAALGQFEQASDAIAEALALDPASSIERWTDRKMLPYRLAEDLSHFADNLRLAGLPE